MKGIVIYVRSVHCTAIKPLCLLPAISVLTTFVILAMIYMKLVKRLRKGGIDLEQHKYNIIDIARLAQVSTATVSRVLHEKGGYSKETETRVRRVIAEYGFQLNKNA